MGVGRRIRNLISYLLVLILFAGCYLLLHGTFFVVIDVTLILLGILDFVNVWYSKKQVEYSLTAPPGDCYQNQRISVGIQVKNSSMVLSANVFLTLRITNEFYHRESVQTFNLPLYMWEDKQLALPLLFENCGKIRVSIEAVTTTGVLGIFRGSILESAESKVFYIFPEKLDISVQDGKYDSEASREQYPKNESEQKGEDAMDVSGIREYVPGDRIRDIHWKLSAKSDNDKLFIKEHVSQSGDGLRLLVELSEETTGERKEVFGDNLLFASRYNPVQLRKQPVNYQQEDGGMLDALLNLLVIFLRNITGEDQKIVLICWNQRMQQLQQTEIWEESQIRQALELLLEAGAYQEQELVEQKAARELMSGSYLWAGKFREEQKGDIVARGKLAAVIQWRMQL